MGFLYGLSARIGGICIGMWCIGLGVAVCQPPVSYRVQSVVIDAGHGGKDPGTHTKYGVEKDIVLKIALKLGKYIEQGLPEVKVYYTRTTDVFVPLEKRAAFANKKNADVFISIHCNWISKPSFYGTETYVMGVHKNDEHFEVAKRENAVITLEDNSQSVYEGFDPNRSESYILFRLHQNAYQQNSINLAEKIETQFEHRAQRHSLGVKTAGFLVLYKTSMPSVLVEAGYLSNAKEGREINREVHQDYIASAIFRAFRLYKEEIENN